MGGIPSGHSVLAIPLNVSDIDLILEGLSIRTTSVPRSSEGGGPIHSAGLKPLRNIIGSARMIERVMLPEEMISFCGILKEASIGEKASVGNIGEELFWTSFNGDIWRLKAIMERALVLLLKVKAIQRKK